MNQIAMPFASHIGTFDEIDENRVYSLDWKNELGTKDFLVTPRVTPDPWRYTIDATKNVFSQVFHPGIEYITAQEYESLPKNWSMGGTIEENIFSLCWRASKNETQFYDEVEGYIKSFVDGTIVKGFGADHMEIKRVCVAVPISDLIESSYLSEKDLRSYLVRDEESDSILVPALSQGRAIYRGRVARLHTFEITLTKKNYFKFNDFSFSGASDEVKSICLDVPDYVISRRAKYLESRRAALKKKGTNLRKFHKKRRKK